MAIEHKIGDYYRAKGYGEDVFELVNILNIDGHRELTLRGVETTEVYYIDESKVFDFYWKIKPGVKI